MLDFKPVDLKYIIRQIEWEHLFGWICQIHRKTQLEPIQLGNVTPRAKHLIWAHLNFTEELARLCKRKFLQKVKLVRSCTYKKIPFSSFKRFYCLSHSRSVHYISPALAARHMVRISRQPQHHHIATNLSKSGITPLRALCKFLQSSKLHWGIVF